MFGLEGLAVQALLYNILPCDDVPTCGACFMFSQHLLKLILGLLLLLGQVLDLLAGGVVLLDQLFSPVRKLNAGVWGTVRELFSQELGH